MGDIAEERRKILDGTYPSEIYRGIKTKSYTML